MQSVSLEVRKGKKSQAKRDGEENETEKERDAREEKRRRRIEGRQGRTTRRQGRKDEESSFVYST